jgi:hypothetical protein
MLHCKQQRRNQSMSVSNTPIETHLVLAGARVWFWWQHPDRTLHGGKGSPQAIDNHLVYVGSEQVPLPGSQIEVILHMPRLEVGGVAARFFGRGTVLPFLPEDRAPEGFVAEVIFESDASAFSLLSPRGYEGSRDEVLVAAA